MVAQTTPVRLFCGYAHEDETLFNQLKKAFEVPVRQETITIWHDGEILPGAEWDTEIEQQLNTADIILLLISPNFMVSEYCWSREMQWAITRHKRGEARVVPILLEPTPAWETTPLGALLALPKDAKPVTAWANRRNAFANIVEELLRVVHEVQQEDKFRVQEYVFGLRPSVYLGNFGDTLAQEMAKHKAEQWLETVCGKIGGTLQVNIHCEDNTEWILIDHQQSCRISMQWDFKGMDIFGRFFRSADIILTSQHPTLLHRMIEAGEQHYWFLQWTLMDNLDLDALVRQIYEQTGKNYGSATLIEKLTNVDYTLYRNLENRNADNSVRVTFSSGGPSSSPRVCLIHDGLPLTGFYRAHTLFSIRKILTLLRGELPYKQIRQFVEDACTYPPL